MGLFGKKKQHGNRAVGPVLLSLYEVVDPGNRAALKKFLSGAPSGCEIVANYPGGSVETAQVVLSAFQRVGLPGPGVVGAEVFGDGFTIYVKGDFSEAAFAELVDAFRQSGVAAGLEVDVTAGRFAPGDLVPLP